MHNLIVGKKGGGSQTTTQKTELPAWVTQAAQGNLNLANQITAPFLSYTPTEAIAPFSESELAAQSMIQDFAETPSGLTREGSGMGVLQNIAEAKPASSVTREGGLAHQAYARAPVAEMQAVQTRVPAATLAPTQVGPVGDVASRNFTDANLQAYMNPYTQNVVDSSLADLDESFSRANAASNLRAAAAGAFGGGRHGIRDAQVTDDYLRNVSRTTSGLRQQAFNTASNLINQDNNRALQAAQANQANQRAIALENARYAEQARAMEQATADRNAERLQAAELANFNEASRQATEQANLALQHRQMDQAGEQTRLQAAQQLAQNALAQQQYNDQLELQKAQALAGVGAQQREMYQAILDAPTRALQTRQATLGATPYPTTTTSTTSGGSGKGGGILGHVGKRLANKFITV